MAFGTGLAAQGVGMGLEAAAQRAAYKTEAKLHEYNARLAERHATVAEQTGLYKEKQFRKRGERFKSEQRVKYAKMGVALEGTPMEVLEDTAAELEKDALMIRRESKLEAQEWESRAAIERAKKESARQAGRYKVASTLLTGGMGAFGSYGKYKGWKGFE